MFAKDSGHKVTLSGQKLTFKFNKNYIFTYIYFYIIFYNFFLLKILFSLKKNCLFAPLYML